MGRSFFLLASAVFLLFSIGLVMIFNITSAEILDKSLKVNLQEAFFKQLLYGLVGIFFGVFLYRIGYQKLLGYSPYLLFFISLLLLLVFIPPLGQRINGARRWISFLGVSVQPSEVAKFVLPLYFIYKVQDRGVFLSFKELLAILFPLSIPILLILLEPDNGAAALILTSLTVLLFLSRVKGKYWVIPLGIFCVLGVGLAYHMPHVSNRIQGYLHPELDLKGKGHQPYQSKIAAGSGGIWGRGFGESFQKLNYLPAAKSDYIAAIYAEETGFLGVCIMLVLYILIAYAGFQIALKARDSAAFYLASIITFLLVFQAFLNLGVVSNLLPSKGTTLPFFSQGGSSLLVNFCAFFLLYSIAVPRKKKKEREHASFL